MKNNVYFNSSFMDDVGFTMIKELLSDSCKFEDNKNDFLNLSPSSDKNSIERNLKYTEELFYLLQRKENLIEAYIKDLNHVISSMSKRGAMIDIENLHETRTLLEYFDKVKAQASKHKLTLWVELIKETEFPKEVIIKINKILDVKGSIKDSASKTLKNIIYKINKVEIDIENKIKDEMEKYTKLGYLNESKIIYRDRKMLLSVNSSSKNKVKGIIIDVSATRQTCYIQPMSIVQLKNKLNILTSEKKSEILHILKNITSDIHPYAKDIYDIYTFMKLYDFHSTISYFAAKFDSIKPEFSDQLDLKKSINPIFSMDDKNYIPLNIFISKKIRTIIISGPNSGGKTIVIKSIGLYAMMAQCGLFIPAKKAKMPIFDSFLSDIGDRQSLKDDLSTFSAHMKEIAHILRKSTKSSLIIIDEMGTGTDPDIGSSLSISILNKLTSKKSLTLCTTHLTPLKLWADESPYAENASMDFDEKNLKPTFIFNPEVPGSSYGIEIAKRMGIDKSIISDARKKIDNKTFDLEMIIRKVNDKDKTLKIKISQIESDIEKLNDNKREILKLKDDLNNKLLKLKKQKQGDIKKYLLSYRKKMESLIENIKKTNADKESIKEAKLFINSNIYQIEKEESNEESVDFNFSVGEIVSIKGINENGEIIQIDKNNNVVLMIDNKKIILKSSEILPAIDKVNNIKDKKYNSNNNISNIKTTRIDLRGKRVDEAIIELDIFLDKAILSNLKSIDILHGTGTGALQEAIHKHLKKVSFIARYKFAPMDQGGMGITIVEL